MASESLTVFGAIDDERHGVTLPRIFTPPLRPLTKETSNGFSVIAFAEIMLHVHLYPWQQWLLVHALELLEDGSYRFRKVIVLVARQNGKTTLMGVLAAWWLFVDSNKHPDRVPPVKFLVVGAAQTLDNAKGPYNQVKEWCNPQPSTDEEADLVIPDLAAMTQKFVNTNGEEAIITIDSHVHDCEPDCVEIANCHYGKRAVFSYQEIDSESECVDERLAS